MKDGLDVAFDKRKQRTNLVIGILDVIWHADCIIRKTNICA